MLKLDSKDFRAYIRQLEDNNASFVLEKKRLVSNLIIGGKYFALSKNKNHAAKENKKKKEVITLFGMVAKNISKYIIKNNLTIKQIKQKHESSYTNKEKYRRMKQGATFYYIDIAHCFWRIAFLKGYISENLYKNVLKRNGLKTYRNMALACIVAPKSREYYDNGKKILDITEDKSHYRIIYDNIRFTSYNTMGNIASKIQKYVIGYRTDGIMATRPSVNVIKKELSDAGFDFKVVKCFKIDDKHFYFGKRIMKI